MRYLPFLVFFCWTSMLLAQAPEIATALEALQAEIGEVEANGRIFEQKMTFLDAENSDEIVFNTIITEKNGKSREERFEFNPIDLDVRLLKREVRGKVMFLTVKTDDNQRMVKYFEDGEQENYRNLFSIAVNDAEAYRRLSDLFEAFIKSAKQVAKTDFSALDFAGQIAFLQAQIGNVKSGDDTYEQSLEAGDAPYIFQLKTAIQSDKNPVDLAAKFNLADLLDKSIKINVSGKKLLVELGTKSNNRWIKTWEESEFKGYDNSIEILVNNTAEARNITSVIKQLIPTAQKMEKEALKSLAGDESQRFEKLKEYVKNVDTDRRQYDQSLEGDCILQFSRETLEEKGSSRKETYAFNLIDFEKGMTDISASNSQLSVEIKSEERMIQHLRDGEIQSYRNSVEFYVQEIEEAKILAYLLQEQIASCREAAKENSWSGQSKEQLFKEATALILDVELPSYTYRQKLETEEGETCKLQFSQTKSTKNKDQESLYDFSLSDINPKTIEFSISGKNLSLQLATKNREKVIKEYEGNEDSDYTDRIQIYMDDLEETRKLIGLLGELTAQCKEDGN